VGYDERRSEGHHGKKCGKKKLNAPTPKEMLIRDEA
jgi:hypothetical protein